MNLRFYSYTSLYPSYYPSVSCMSGQSGTWRHEFGMLRHITNTLHYSINMSICEASVIRTRALTRAPASVARSATGAGRHVARSAGGQKTRYMRDCLPENHFIERVWTPENLFSACGEKRCAAQNPFCAAARNTPSGACCAKPQFRA